MSISNIDWPKLFQLVGLVGAAHMEGNSMTLQYSLNPVLDGPDH